MKKKLDIFTQLGVSPKYQMMHLNLQKQTYSNLDKAHLTITQMEQVVIMSKHKHCVLNNIFVMFNTYNTV